MIEPRVFAAQMALLEQRYNKTLSDPILHEYLEYLNPRLASDQFAQAAKTVRGTDTFYPSPARLVEVALGSIDDRAALEWMALLAAHNAGQRAENVTASARKIWSETYSAGQLNAADGTERLSFIRRDFLSSYRAFHAIGELPPGVMQPLTTGEKRNELENLAHVQAEAKRLKGEAEKNV